MGATLALLVARDKGQMFSSVFYLSREWRSRRREGGHPGPPGGREQGIDVQRCILFIQGVEEQKEGWWPPWPSWWPGTRARLDVLLSGMFIFSISPPVQASMKTTRSHPCDMNCL
jgi:hypothetical protein